MPDPGTEGALPPIPRKRYFAIGEAGELCAVKPHVLRYWETEFPQLKPVKRRGNRRYYQREDIVMIRRIKHLLYDQGYTIGGARRLLSDGVEEAGGIEVSRGEIGALAKELERLIEELR